jgi:hypothetical protein
MICLHGKDIVFCEKTDHIDDHNLIKVEQMFYYIGYSYFPAFNNFSVISCQALLLMEETAVPGEITDLSQVTDKIYQSTTPPIST